MTTAWCFSDLTRAIEEASLDDTERLYRVWKQDGAEHMFAMLAECQIGKRQIVSLLHRFMRERNSVMVKELLHYFRHI